MNKNYPETVGKNPEGQCLVKLEVPREYLKNMPNLRLRNSDVMNLSVSWALKF
jgi:hypothetical protein